MIFFQVYLPVDLEDFTTENVALLFTKLVFLSFLVGKELTLDDIR